MAENVYFKYGTTAEITAQGVQQGKFLIDYEAKEISIDKDGTNRVVLNEVDTALSTISTNAIQNKALTNSIINTTAEVSAITVNSIPCGTKPVKELITNVNAKKMQLLWTNSSPTVAFSPQIISINLSTYDAVHIVCDQVVGLGTLYDFIIPIDNSVHLINVNSAYKARWRNCTPAFSGINFQAGYVDSYNSATGGTIDNISAVPIRIYGIKY